MGRTRPPPLPSVPAWPVTGRLLRTGKLLKKYKPLLNQCENILQEQFISSSVNNDAKPQAKERSILASKATQLVVSRQIVIQIKFLKIFFNVR
jgi:hypothetical protein